MKILCSSLKEMLRFLDGSWKVLIIWDFESSCTVCTSAPHWVTQIAARRLNSGNSEADSVGSEEVSEMKMVAVGECSSACRPRNIPQLPPSSSPRPPPYPPRPSLRFPRLTSPQQSMSPNEEQMYTFCLFVHCRDLVRMTIC